MANLPTHDPLISQALLTTDKYSFTANLPPGSGESKKNGKGSKVSTEDSPLIFSLSSTKSIADVNTASLKKEGICLDESSLQVSFTHIPSSVPRSKISAQVKTISLPSSPSKTSPCRSLEDLRVEICLMKDQSFGMRKPAEDGKSADSKPYCTQRVTCYESSKWPILGETAPMESSSVANEPIGTPLMNPASIVSQEFKSMSAAASNLEPWIEVHDSSCDQLVHNPPPHYPVKALAQDKNQATPLNLSDITYSPNNHAKTSVQSYHYLCNTHDSPPKPNNLKSREQLSTTPNEPSFDFDFPPINGTKPGSPPLVTEQAPSGSKPSWSQLFSSNIIRTNGIALEFIPKTQNKDGTNTPVSITVEQVFDELRRWDNVVVGQVIGAKPPFKLMKQFIDRRWKAFASIDLYILKAGLFIFNFQDEETKLKVLELGPWSYYDKPLILKPWSPTET